MTNEEAIFDLEQFALAPIGDGDLHRESVEAVLSALREQAEREKLQSNCKACVGSVRDEKRSIRFCECCGRPLKEVQHE